MTKAQERLLAECLEFVDGENASCDWEHRQVINPRNGQNFDWFHADNCRRCSLVEKLKAVLPSSSGAVVSVSDRPEDNLQKENA